MTYKSTNAFGWPQIIVSVYGTDAFGRDVIKGYGCMHLPTAAGRYNLKLRLYKPRSASMLQQFTSWITGTSFAVCLNSCSHYLTSSVISQ